MPIAEPGTMSPQRDTAPSHSADLVIPSDPAEVRRVQDQIEQLLQARYTPDHDVFSIRLALEEALVNAIKHGNQMDRSKKVHVGYRLFADRFEVVVTDEGRGFDPDDVPDPTAVENLERPCGRGLLLMRHYMNHIEYVGPGNCVVMSKWAIHRK